MLYSHDLQCFTGMSLHWTNHISYLSCVTETNQRATCLHSFQSPNSNLGNRRSTSFLLTLTPASSLLSHQSSLHFQKVWLASERTCDSHLKESATRIWTKVWLASESVTRICKKVWLACEGMCDSHVKESETRIWKKVWLASEWKCDSHLKESLTRRWRKVWLACERKCDSHVKESATSIWKKAPNSTVCVLGDRPVASHG